MVNQAFIIKIAYREKKKENTRDRSVPDGSDKYTMPFSKLFCTFGSHNCCSITRSFLHISLKYSFPGDGFTALPLVNSGGFQTNAADFLFQPDVVKDR